MEELFKNKWNNLAVFFERPPLDLIEKTKEYNYVIFNHVGFHLPYYGSIYENVGQGLGVPQESADKYMPKNHVKIILPIKLTGDVRKVMEKHIAQYGYCVPFVANVLKDLKILPKDAKYEGVDELYFALLKYRFSTNQVKEFYKKGEGKK